MDKDDRRGLILEFCPWPFRELTPEWFLVEGGIQFSLLHICRPGTWAKLQYAMDNHLVMGDEYFEDVIFTNWKKGSCKACGDDLPKHLHTLIKLLILGKSVFMGTK